MCCLPYKWERCSHMKGQLLPVHIDTRSSTSLAAATVLLFADLEQTMIWTTEAVSLAGCLLFTTVTSSFWMSLLLVWFMPPAFSVTWACICFLISKGYPLITNTLKKSYFLQWICTKTILERPSSCKEILRFMGHVLSLQWTDLSSSSGFCSHNSALTCLK